MVGPFNRGPKMFQPTRPDTGAGTQTLTLTQEFHARAQGANRAAGAALRQLRAGGGGDSDLRRPSP